VTREAIPAGRPVSLDRTERYIFVVGAATDGESALFDPATDLYERIRVGKGAGRGSDPPPDPAVMRYGISPRSIVGEKGAPP
jgi:hypothetical protein